MLSLFQSFPSRPTPVKRPVLTAGMVSLAVATASLWLLATRTTAAESPHPASNSLSPVDVSNRVTPPTPEQINAWIDSLRHDAYSVRQAAARQLLAAGSAARAPLVAAADSPDPEARAAARRLVALIDKAENDHRLSAFAADVDGKKGLTLPGWEKFQKLVGGDAAARALFVEMQRQEAALLADVFSPNGGPRKQAWEDRLLRLLRGPATPGGQPVSPSLGTCATMIFLGSVSEAKISDQAATYLPPLMQRPPVQEILSKADRQDPLRRLVVAWVTECPNRSANVVSQRLSLALMFNMQEALPLALGVALGEPEFATVHPMIRAQALILVAHMGGRSDAGKLEPLLEDATPCRSMAALQPGQAVPVAREIQIRDLALVTMLLLTEQDPVEYGYIHARRQTQQLLDLGTVYTESDEQRLAAIAKWRNWKAQQGRDKAAEKQVN